MPDASYVLSECRKRNSVEKLFLSSMSFSDGEPLRVHDMETLNGHLFVKLISLVIMVRIAREKRSSGLIKKYPVEKMLLWNCTRSGRWSSRTERRSQLKSRRNKRRFCPDSQSSLNMCLYFWRVKVLFMPYFSFLDLSNRLIMSERYCVKNKCLHKQIAKCGNCAGWSGVSSHNFYKIVLFFLKTYQPI